MKSKIAVALTILLLFALMGCNNTPQAEKIPEPFSFSESNEISFETDTLPAKEETSEVESTPESLQSTEYTEAETRSMESRKLKEPEQIAVQTSAPQEESLQTAEEGRLTPAVVPETETSLPVQTETAESETPTVTPETDTPPSVPPAQTETAESIPP